MSPPGLLSTAALVVVALGGASRAAASEEKKESPGASPEVSQVKVEIKGLGEVHRSNVESSLAIEQSKKKEGLTATRLRQLHARAPEHIARALEPFGYYRARVVDELRQDGTIWTARYEVDKGPRMRVEKVEVEVTGPGAVDPEFVAAVRDFPLAPGDGLSHAAYEEGKGGFVEHAAESGYLDGAFETAEIRVDLDRYTSEVALRFATGPRYHFGDVRFHQTVLDPDVLAGYVTFKRGAPVDIEELLALQDALSSSPYFQRVEVVTRPEEAVGLEVPVDVDLVPAARQKWDLGIGYGTDTGPRGKAGLQLRRINRRGHRGEGEVTLSAIEKSLATRYLIPGAYPRTDVVTLTLGYSELSPDTSTSQTALAGVGLTRSRGSWREAYGLTFQRSDFEVGVDSGISELIVPEASWSRVKADDRIYPRAGHRLEFRLRGAGEALLSDSSFAQVTADAKLIRSVGDRLRVIGRIGAGYTWTSDLRSLPPAFRFFAGGDQSVRGYGYQELGPPDVEGNVIGGEALAIASLEIDSLFLDLGKFGRWGAAAFYDVGGAASTLGERLEEGIGLGLRWLSPIGLVRADVAWAVSEPGTPARIHLMIGPDL